MTDKRKNWDWELLTTYALGAFIIAFALGFGLLVVLWR